MKPKVSVIVPVYKVEVYLAHCLDSLCQQSLSDIELLVIDDASPDGCGAMCDDYATKDARITVFHQPENRGLSAARNLGIRHAKGQYLMFVDGDDWVREDFCQAAYECAEQHQADLVMFNYARVVHSEVSRHEEPKVFTSFTEGLHTKEESLDMMLEDGGNAAWNKIYRKDLFDGITYPEGFLYEDTGATYKLVYKASCFYFLDQTLYFQYIRPNSITQSKITPKMLNDRAILNTQRYCDLKAWGFDSEMLESRLINFALWYCFYQKRDMSNPAYANLMEAVRSCPAAPKTFSLKKKVIFYLFKYCPWLAELLFSFIRSKKVK